MSASAKGRIDRQYDEMLEADERREAKRQPLIAEGILEFCKNKLNFTPYDYQEKLMMDPAQFIVARWCRQSGKSHTIASMLLHQALSKPDTRMVIVAPSLRQARKIISRDVYFANQLSEQGVEVLQGRPTKTRLEFKDGSTIEALPNNPPTIRGETANLVFADELNYIQNDEEVYEAIVYALNTTNGRFIGTSTPGSTDSLFFKMCTDDDKFGDVSRHHVTYKEALEPNGPLKLKIVQKLERQNRDDPSRWIREMMAEFAEDQDAWFPLSLITRCVSNMHEVFDDSALLREGFILIGTFYVGCDLGKKQDFSAIAVVEKLPDGTLRLVHLRRFKLGTEYGSVLGYLKLLNQKLATVRTIEIDQTGLGDYFVEDAIHSGIKNAHGTILTLPMKQQIMGLMKKKMEDGKFAIPYDWDLINELNIERYELTKTGQIQFSHPSGTHDDRLWAVALAVQAARSAVSEYHPVAALSRSPSSYRPSINWRQFLPGASTYIPRPGDPGGVVIHGQLWCWACGRPVLQRPHVCEKNPS